VADLAAEADHACRGPVQGMTPLTKQREGGTDTPRTDPAVTEHADTMAWTVLLH
jgi:hypothetical protein